VVKSIVMICARQVARMGDGRGAGRVLVGIPEVKMPLGRAGRRWKDNITVYVKGIGWGRGAWNRSDQVTGASEFASQFSGSLYCWEILE